MHLLHIRKREICFQSCSWHDQSYPPKTSQDLSLQHKIGLFGWLWMASDGPERILMAFSSFSVEDELQEGGGRSSEFQTN